MKLEHLLVLTIGGVLLALAGCSEQAPAKLSGEVTFDGKPLTGVMRLFPSEGNVGKAAGTEVRDGRYTLGETAGLVAGAYRVEIQATKPTGKKVPRTEIRPGESEFLEEVVQFIPEKYNVKSTLRVELTTGDNEKTFDLRP